jgi:hypothetical protein
MMVAALLSAGAPLGGLRKALKQMEPSIRVSARRVRRAGLEALLFKVGGGGKRLSPAQMRRLLRRLPQPLRDRALQVLQALLQAEARVHGTESPHLHELGSLDTVADIAGTLWCLQALQVQALYASEVNVGSGSLQGAHGSLPVPAPATAELLRGVPVYSSGITAELATPTGAALLKVLVKGFGPLPRMRLLQVGTGAGARQLQEGPNVLRFFLGQAPAKGPGLQAEGLFMLQCNIDDMNPQLYPYLMERLFEAGALEVFWSPVYMKKARPGMLLSVLCRAEHLEALREVLFSESTTLGLRLQQLERYCLERESRLMRTRFGPIRFKLWEVGGRRRLSPEFDDCLRAARRLGVPLLEVLQGLRTFKP